MGVGFMKEHNMEALQNHAEQIEEMLYFRHDFLNHMYVIKLYLEMGMVDKSLAYINKLMKHTDSKMEDFTTGNVELDIVMSQKLYKIKDIGAKVKLNCSLTENVKFDVFDIMTIIGNLLDNCYEALLKAEIKELIVDIEVIDDIMYISITNTYSEEVNKDEENIITSKDDKKNHGLGLKSCRKCVEKNRGTMDIYYDENDFNVDIKLPLLHKKNN